MHYAVKISLLISIFVSLILYFFSGAFLALFTNNINLIGIGIVYFSITVYAYPFLALIYMISKLFQVSGHPNKDLLINLSRLAIFFIPLVWLLVYEFNWRVEGILYARLLATILTFFLAIIFYKRVSKEIKGACE